MNPLIMQSNPHPMKLSCHAKNPPMSKWLISSSSIIKLMQVWKQLIRLMVHTTGNAHLNVNKPLTDTTLIIVSINYPSS